MLFVVAEIHYNSKQTEKDIILIVKEHCQRTACSFAVPLDNPLI